MKVFDFEVAQKMGVSLKKLDWFYRNKDKKISEEEFVAALRELKEFRNGKAGKYAPSSLKKEYKNLKEKFGFFVGK